MNKLSAHTPQQRNGKGRKCNVYMDGAVYTEIEAEAQRLERSVSWLVQQAWKIARERLSNAVASPELIERAAREHK